MTLFLLFLGCGFAELWLLLVLWGFSAGPVTPVPYVALVGCLVLLLAAAPLALFLPRVSAVIALAGAALAFAWPVAGVFTDSGLEALPFAAAPITAAIAASRRLWRTRRTPWLATVARPHVWVRIALCVLTFVLFVSMFNARMLLAILRAGPP